MTPARTLGAGLAAAVLVLSSAVPMRADTACDFVQSPSCSCAAQTPTSPPCPPSTAPCQIMLPSGFPCPNIPDDNPLTKQKIELGRFLFYDTRLSLPGLEGAPPGSGEAPEACASCHQQDKAFTDGRATALGSTGASTPRSAMSLANVAYASTLTWANPTVVTLETQAMIPMFGESPVELGLTGKEPELSAALHADPRYVRMFADAFPGMDDPLDAQVITQTVTRAIASFERTLISGNSPYDRFRLGKDDHAISDAAQHGLDLFLQSEAENCFHCHQAFNLTTSSDYKGLLAPNITFVNTGLYNLRCSDFNLPALDLLWCDNPPDPVSCMQQNDSQPLGCQCNGTGPQPMGCYPPPNTGTYSVDDKPENMGRFKPPTLRNIAVTAPYMHDGSVATLDAVLDHYSAGGRTITDGPYAGVGAASPTKGQFLRGFALNDSDRAALIAFLQSLTDQDFLTDPHFGDPFGPVSCPGDCNLDGKVDVNELTSAIGVSLDSSSLALCVTSDVNGDGAVTIDELLRAIGGALNGCG